jgi:hypothetical protein
MRGGDRGSLRRIARGERDVVTVVAEEAREGRPPRSGANDDRLHGVVTK